MLCCFESTAFSGAESDGAKQSSTDAVSSYPGQRRSTVIPTIPLSEDFSAQHDSISVLASEDKHHSDVLISVTVPEGMVPGQKVHVRRPDGVGELLEAVIPVGMTAGSIFYVRAPLKEEKSSSVGPLQLQDGPRPPSDFFQRLEKSQPAEAEPTNRQGARIQSPCIAPHPPPGQKLLLVQVTDEMIAGSELWVRIPDEGGRLVSAKVPADATEFVVAYWPQPLSTGTDQNAPLTSDTGSTVLPIVGSLATGVLAAMAYEHYVH